MNEWVMPYITWSGTIGHWTYSPLHTGISISGPIYHVSDFHRLYEPLGPSYRIIHTDGGTQEIRTYAYPHEVK